MTFLLWYSIVMMDETLLLYQGSDLYKTVAINQMYKCMPINDYFIDQQHLKIQFIRNYTNIS